MANTNKWKTVIVVVVLAVLKTVNADIHVSKAVIL